MVDPIFGMNGRISLASLQNWLSVSELCACIQLIQSVSLSSWPELVQHGVCVV
jgi:hypothetical protein